MACKCLQTQEKNSEISSKRFKQLDNIILIFTSPRFKEDKKLFDLAMAKWDFYEKDYKQRKKCEEGKFT